jgi:hypothetical protein
VEELRDELQPAMGVLLGKPVPAVEGQSDEARLDALRLSIRVQQSEVNRLKHTVAVKQLKERAEASGSAVDAERVQTAHAKRDAAEKIRAEKLAVKELALAEKKRQKELELAEKKRQKEEAAEAKRALKAEAEAKRKLKEAAAPRKKQKQPKEDQKKAEASIYKNGCIVLGSKHLSSKISHLEVLEVKHDKEEDGVVIEARFMCSSGTSPETGEVMLVADEFMMWPLAVSALTRAGHRLPSGSASSGGV